MRAPCGMAGGGVYTSPATDSSKNRESTTMTRAIALLSLLFSASLLAQSAAPSPEFLRGSGGEISVITKNTAGWSGSLGISAGSSLGLGSRTQGYDATLGGTLVEDRMWFFASAQKSDGLFGSASPQSPGAAEAVSRAIDAKLAMQLGSRQNLAATFASQAGTQPAFAIPGTTPSTFLSLRYTGIISDSMFFNTSFSRSSGPRWPGFDPR